MQETQTTEAYEATDQDGALFDVADTRKGSQVRAG